MLVLQRKVGEKLIIGDDIVITVVDIRDGGHKVRLGIDCPRSIAVDRQEVRESKDAGRRTDA